MEIPSIKRNKSITKIHNLVNIKEINKIGKQIEEIEQSEDDSTRMFKTIKDLRYLESQNIFKKLKKNFFDDLYLTFGEE